MKKVLKRLLCLALSGLSVCSIAACGKNSGEEISNTNTNVQKIYADNSENHIRSISDTNQWILQNGATQYQIVVRSETLTRAESYAKTEITNLFKEATGVELNTITDAGMQYSSDAKYISIGTNNLYETSGLNVNFKPLREDGARVITKGNTIFLLGGSENGVLYAAYEFLNDILNFETYFKDTYTLNKDVREIKLKKYDITEIPDIPFRRQGTGALLNPNTNEYNDTMYKYRLRATDVYTDRMTMARQRWDEPNSKKSGNHNSWMFLPKDEYEQSDPEFYSTQGNQLCFTARGNEVKYEKMVDLVFKKTIQALQWDTPELYPKKNCILIGMEDNLDWCACDACKEIIDYYGANSATILMFCNEIAERVHAWMDLPENAEYAREDFDIMFFAYSSCLKAPFQWDEEKQAYTAKDERIIPHENVTIFLAVSGFDHGATLDNKENTEVRQTIAAWSTFMDRIFTWSYGGFIQDYFTFVDVYSFYEEAYNFFYSIKTEFSVAQQHSSQRGADSAFFIMAGYVGAKLMWNSTLDVKVLINNYMNAMYREAAPYMMALFNLERVWFNTMHVKKSWTHTFWWLEPSYSEEYWTIGYVNQCFDALEKAYNAIERYKGDPELYKSLKDNIDMEWLHPAKVAIDSYKKSFKAAEYKKMQSDFKEIVTRLGMSYVGETSPMDKYLNGWVA